MKHAKVWIVATLLVAANAFAQDAGDLAAREKDTKNCKPAPSACPTPTPPTQLCTPAPQTCCEPWPVPVLNAAYNYPARTLTRCPWELYLDASFIFWQPIEDSVTLGAVAAATTTGALTNVQNADNPKFKPGFKVGIGGSFDYDNWDLHAEYTWFHNTQHTSTVATGGTEVLQGLTDDNYTSASQSWNLKMDLADLDLGRWHYTGTKFTVHPSFGMRGAWIRQQLDTTGTGTQTGTIAQRSVSWGVGPKAALNGNWHFGSGFRFFGDVEGDVLYTQYTRLSTTIADSNSSSNASFAVNNLSALRAHFDLELGFAYGTYLDCNKYYLDAVLGYGFQVFFDQNMFRDQQADKLPNGNLYVNGLTASLRLDF